METKWSPNSHQLTVNELLDAFKGLQSVTMSVCHTLHVKTGGTSAAAGVSRSCYISTKIPMSLTTGVSLVQTGTIDKTFFVPTTIEDKTGVLMMHWGVT